MEINGKSFKRETDCWNCGSNNNTKLHEYIWHKSKGVTVTRAAMFCEKCFSDLDGEGEYEFKDGIRAKILEVTSHKPLQLLDQYDVFFVGKDCQDYIMVPDEDGDWISKHCCYELRYTDCVSLIVPSQTKTSEAIRQVKKILIWLEHEPEIRENLSTGQKHRMSAQPSLSSSSSDQIADIL